MILNLEIQIPHYSTLSRGQGDLNITFPTTRSDQSVHLVVDSTGVKVFGEGKWKTRKHGYTKRRTWRKLHVALDEKTGEILAVELTKNNVDDAQMVKPLLDQTDRKISDFSGDGACDKKRVYDGLDEKQINPIIPPQKNAKIKQHGNTRKKPLPGDENIRGIRRHGRKKWKQITPYHRRSIAENAIFRYKTIIGKQLKTRCFDKQSVECKIGVKILNRMQSLARPKAYKIENDK